MKGSVLAGILLIVVGALVLAFPTLTFTDREEVADIGPIEVTAETEDRVTIPALVGGVVIVAGVGLLLYRR
jgi:hypothetical protein